MKKFIFTFAVFCYSASGLFAQTAANSEGLFNRSTLIGGVIGAIVGGFAGYYFNKSRSN